MTYVAIIVALVVFAAVGLLFLAASDRRASCFVCGDLQRGDNNDMARHMQFHAVAQVDAALDELTRSIGRSENSVA